MVNYLKLNHKPLNKIINLQSKNNILSNNQFINKHFMRSTTNKLLPLRNTRSEDNKRTHSLKSYETNTSNSSANSKKSFRFKKAVPHINLKNLFDSQMKIIQCAATSYTQSSASSNRNMSDIKFKKDQQQKYLEEKLEEMKEDKFKYLIFKNKIRRKFHKVNTNHGDAKIKQIDRQLIYEPTKSQTICVNPFYEKSCSTFFSKSRKKVCEQDCPEDDDLYLSQYKQRDQSDVNYLKYVSNQSHRRTFRKTIKSKTFGSVHLDTNKQEIVRLVTEGRKQNQLLFEYIEQILHQN